jgi:phosphoserine phosphatase
VASPVERSAPPAAAFFDLDKTIISRSSTLAFGPSFYRNGLISRGDVVRGTLAQMAFRFGGASHQRMERIRDRVSQVCRGWPADKVAEIVTENLPDLIVPLVYAEAQALLTQHRLAGQDVVIVSTSGQEVVAPIGYCSGSPRSLPPGWR